MPDEIIKEELLTVVTNAKDEPVAMLRRAPGCGHIVMYKCKPAGAADYGQILREISHAKLDERA